MDKERTLAFHRCGNSLEGLAAVERLSQNGSFLEDRLKADFSMKESVTPRFAVEGDLKWCGDLLYLHHARLTAGKPLKSKEEIYRKAEAGKVLLFEDAIKKYPHIRFIIDVKNGYGPLDEALQQSVESVKRHGDLDNYWVLSLRSWKTNEIKQALPDVKVGTYYQWEKIGSVNLLTKDNKGDYLIAPPHYHGHGKNGSPKKPYMNHTVTKSTLQPVLANGSIGGIVKMEPKDFYSHVA